MGITDNLRKQHKEMLGITNQILSCLNSGSLAKDAAHVRDLLSILEKKLLFHLIKEDDSLYPALLTHPTKSVKALAKIYIDKMGGIRKDFTDYMAKWPDAMSIQVNAESFINETKLLFEALSIRIDKEDNELYVFVDR
jgi:hemerythrin-like domain-containing protein